MCAKREEAAPAVHHRHHGRVHQSSLAQAADGQFDMGALDPDQRVRSVSFAPREPLPQLELVQVVASLGIAGQEGECRQLGGRPRCRPERQQRSWSGHRVTSRGDPLRGPRHARRYRGQALEPSDARPEAAWTLGPTGGYLRRSPGRMRRRGGSDHGTSDTVRVMTAREPSSNSARTPVFMWALKSAWDCLA